MIEGNRVAHKPSTPEDSDITIHFPQDGLIHDEDALAITEAMKQALNQHGELAEHYPGSVYEIDHELGAICVTNYFLNLPLENAEKLAVDAAREVGEDHGIKFPFGHPAHHIKPLGSIGLRN